MSPEQWELPRDSGMVLRRVLRRIERIASTDRRRRLRRIAPAAVMLAAVVALTVAIAFTGGSDARRVGHAGDSGTLEADAAIAAGGAAAPTDVWDGIAAGSAPDTSVGASGSVGIGTSLGPPPAADDDDAPAPTGTVRQPVHDDGPGAPPKATATPTHPGPTATREPCPLVCVTISTPTIEPTTPTMGCPPLCLPIETPTEIAPLCASVCLGGATPTPALCPPICVEVNPSPVPTIAVPTTTLPSLCPPVCP